MKDKEKTKNQPISEPTKKKQILIVEDERVVIKDIKMNVQKLGYAVSGIAFSGEEAIKKAEELHPDLVLMDIVLVGKMNGIKAAEIIRSRFNIPIVYLTAHSDKKTLERAKQTEPFGYILKPFSDRDLSTTIEMALYKHKTEEALKESEEFNFALFKHNPIQTIAVDKSGRVTNFNMAKKTSGDRLPNIGDVMYKDYAGEHEINMHAELMECIKSKKVKRFSEMKYRDKYLDITLAPFPQGAIITTQDITERKMAEEKLQMSEERYRALFEQAADSIVLVDGETGALAEFNDRAYENLGYTHKEFEKLKIPDFEIIESPEEVKKHIKKIIKEGSASFETKHKTKKGKIKNIHVTSRAIVIRGKNFIQSIWQDITERKQTEEVLKESEERYRDLVEKAGIGILIYDREGNIKYFNETYMDMLKYSRKEMKKQSIQSIIHPDDVEKVLKYHKNRIQGRRTPSRYEYRSIRKDGSTIHVEVDAVALRENGEITGSRSYIWDITERKMAEEALRQSEDTYRTLFESGNDPVLILSLNGTLISANQKAADTLGYKVEEMIGMSYKDIISPNEIQDADDKMKSFKKSKTFPPYERYARKKNGTEFPTEVNVSIVRDEENKPAFIQSIFRDITERKQEEEELKASREQLRNLAAHLQAVREGERTSIAREIHDDLGQSLTALKMDLSLLTPKLPKDQKSLFKRTESMSKLIDSTIQTVQRISAEMRPGVLDDIGLPAALEWQGNEFQKRTGIKCELTVEPEDIFLDKDRSTAIFRIFQETLTNVARHSKAEWIKVNLKKRARKIELKVRDNGKGITEEQISNSKSFGLIGIRERVQYFGGEVEIKGIQNRGTTLKVWIPLPKEKKGSRLNI